MISVTRTYPTWHEWRRIRAAHKRRRTRTSPYFLGNGWSVSDVPVRILLTKTGCL